MMRHFLVSALLFFSCGIVSSLPSFAQEPGFRIAAVVNDDAITDYDVRERIKFVMATTGLKGDAKTAAKLYPRIINSLIDEQLQLQEAKRFNIAVADEEITATIANIEKEQGKPEGSLKAFLEQSGISYNTLYNQLYAQIAWAKLLQQKVVSKVKVSDEDVERTIEQVQQQQKHVAEVKVTSILLPATQNESEDAAKKLADNIVEKLRSGADLRMIALQLSVRDLANVTPSWVPLRDLDPSISGQIMGKALPIVLDPVKTPSGYQILKVSEERVVDYRLNAEVMFKEIILTLQPDASREEVEVLMAIARDVRKDAGGCQTKDVAGATNLEDLKFEVNYTRTNLADISDEVLPLVRGLQVGEISEPFATPEGIRLLKLCEKAERPVQQVDSKALKRKLREDKFRLEAVRYLRDLRRNAFIDIRLKS